MSLAALILAIISTLLALGSLVWQMVTHVLSGPRVKSTLKLGLARPGGGEAITWEPRAAQQIDQLNDLRGKGYTVPILLVTASNLGRMATTVQGVTFQVSGGAVYQPVGDMNGPALPARLAEADELSWVVPSRAVFAAAEVAREALDGDGTFGVTVEFTGGSAVAPERVQAA